jgi:hypothetical protein
VGSPSSSSEDSCAAATSTSTSDDKPDYQPIDRHRRRRVSVDQEGDVQPLSNEDLTTGRSTIAPILTPEMTPTRSTCELIPQISSVWGCRRNKWSARSRGGFEIHITTRWTSARCPEFGNRPPQRASIDGIVYCCDQSAFTTIGAQTFVCQRYDEKATDYSY